MSRRRHIKARKLYPAIAIVGQGITEQIYFIQLRKMEKLSFTLKPNLPKHSDIKSIVTKAKDLLKKEFDVIFCVIDIDEINRNQVVKDQYFELRKRYHNKGNIFFIENNPCMEFWFLLHYKETTRFFNNYRQLETELKKHIADYEKTVIYLTRKNIYNVLKPFQDHARQNAIKGIGEGKGEFSKSEVYQILDFLKVK
ncbi:MAG: RloB domain-containing protein [Bacteroidetes bacterium]|nr:RloB domain-containing protein [Bacteroidota bacterium]